MVRINSQAKQYALINKLYDEADTIRRLAIRFQLDTYLSHAQKEFEEKDWKKAIEQYSKLLLLMAKTRKHLDKSYLDSFGEVRKYLLISQIAIVKQTAETAEMNQAFDTALNAYEKSLTSFPIQKQIRHMQLKSSSQQRIPRQKALKYK